jgi:hypothetical protein
MTMTTPAHNDPAPTPARPHASRSATTLGFLGYAVLVAVVGCVAVMSWRGLVGFAHDELGITSPLRFVVPLSLDAAAMATAFLALRSVVLGDSAAGARLMVLAFVGASAWFNITHADHHGGIVAAQYFGGMSLAAWGLYELVLRHVRRDVLRAVGALEPPLVRFRGVRWARFPLATFRAWSLAVEHGITHAEDALALARGQSAGTPAPPAPARPASSPRSTPAPAPALDMGAHDATAAARALPSKADQLRYAFSVIGSYDVPAALAWLTERGIPALDRSTAHKVARREREARRPGLAVVGGVAQ